MLNEQQIIAYLDGALSAAERARIEAELERDPQLRRELVRQSQLDAALRAALGSDAANQRVKESILTVLRGESEATLKQQVMADATRSADWQSAVSPTGSRQAWKIFARQLFQRPAGCQPARQQTASLRYALAGLLQIFRRPAFGLGFAAALIVAVVWFAQRPVTTVASIELPTRVELAGSTTQPKSGEIIRAEASYSATVKFADGTTLHLEPGTEISLVAVDSKQSGGKQLKLLTGSLSAEVANQPPGLPLLIQTPHALVTVVGTEFDLSVATNQTALEVTRGLVKMTGAGETNPVSVAAGEFAVAAPKRAMQFGRLARHPFLWPFSSASIWNRPLGSGAKFSAVTGKSFLADGPLADGLRSRRPTLGAPADPLRRIWVNGEARADVRLADAKLPGANLTDSWVLLQQGRRYALELRGVTVRDDGDLEAHAITRTDLAGLGTEDSVNAAKPFGLSNLGGLIRSGEWENGIRHALSARVSRERLAGRNFQNPFTVWPAAGNAASGAEAEKLCVGTLLAIPPDVDIKKLFSESGPAYELARAMQDYGVYVTGFIDAPFVLLADDANVPRADEWLNQLVPLLKIVPDNLPETPGGGTPRREPAPALPDEAK